MKVVAGTARVEELDDFLDRLAAIGETYDATVQSFDARYVAGRDHLRTAVEHAERSLARGENVAHDPAVEILLYAAGRRQIDQALRMGVAEGTGPVVVVVVGGDEAGAATALEALLTLSEGWTPDDERLTSFFDVSPAERAATAADLEALVGERVALLDVEK